MSYKVRTFTKTDGSELEIVEKHDLAVTVTRTKEYIEGRCVPLSDVDKILERFLHYRTSNLKSFCSETRYNDENMG